MSLLDSCNFKKLIWKISKVKYFNYSLIQCLLFKRDRYWIQNVSMFIDLYICNLFSLIESQESRDKFLYQTLTLKITFNQFLALSLQNWKYICLIFISKFIDMTWIASIKYSSILFELGNFGNDIFIGWNKYARINHFNPAFSFNKIEDNDLWDCCDNQDLIWNLWVHIW